MAGGVHRTARIIAAIEDLSAQEAAAVRAHDFSTLQEIQDRLAPLVTDLTAVSVSDEPLKARIRSIQEQRAKTSDLLASELSEARLALRETMSAQRRTAQVAPAYGAKPVGPQISKLSCVG
jgi:hypothetical protein